MFSIVQCVTSAICDDTNNSLLGIKLVHHQWKERLVDTKNIWYVRFEGSSRMLAVNKDLSFRSAVRCFGFTTYGSKTAIHNRHQHVSELGFPPMESLEQGPSTRTFWS